MSPRYLESMPFILRLVHTIRFSDLIFTQIQRSYSHETILLRAETMPVKTTDPKMDRVNQPLEADQRTCKYLTHIIVFDATLQKSHTKNNHCILKLLIVMCIGPNGSD